MPSRVSIPLVICLLASAVAAIALTGVFDGAAESAEPAVQTAADTPVVDAPASPPTEAANITIANFAFGEPISVQPGQTVSVENVDGAPHTVTATEGGFDTGTLGGGATGSFTAPSEPGTYAFFCQIHPSMTGTITVSS